MGSTTFDTYFVLFFLKASAEKEKNKGYFCLTRQTIEQTEVKTIEETSFSADEDTTNQFNSTTPIQTQRIPESNPMSDSSKLPLDSKITGNSDVTDHQMISVVSRSNQPIHNLTVIAGESQEDEKMNTKTEPKFDISDCTASVNKEDLKMLSLLDFAGQSAYYACHHIFFSPRAFFILVIDMTKKLTDVAIEACRKQGLIYSNWTYEGNLFDCLLIYDSYLFLMQALVKDI